MSYFTSEMEKTVHFKEPQSSSPRKSGRTSSAFRKSRFLSHSVPSEYHDKCAPQNKEGQTPPAPQPPPTASKGTPGKLDLGGGKDPVSQDQLWKDYVHSEKRRVEEWQENWAFMTEYDQKGEKKEKPELSEEGAKVYSANVPNTQTGAYGSRLNTELGSTMQRLEFKFYAGHRKKKQNDLVCI